ncbi:MAG TPA: hypothetical protein VMA95_21625, partial [Streptosporangiaceae bacterium]|nr:hypothetical protein [Streptosporangiaceae bacterium]
KWMLDHGENAQAAFENEIRKAGEPGSVVVINLMGGRGLDIRVSSLGIDLGGLYVRTTSHSEFADVIKQILTRAGRNGDPGDATVYTSPDDKLFKESQDQNVQYAIIKYTKAYDADHDNPTPATREALEQAEQFLRDQVPVVQAEVVRRLGLDVPAVHLPGDSSAPDGVAPVAPAGLPASRAPPRPPPDGELHQRVAELLGHEPGAGLPQESGAGLGRLSDSGVGQLLDQAGSPPDDLHQRVTELLGHEPGAGSPRWGSPPDALADDLGQRVTGLRGPDDAERLADLRPPDLPFELRVVASARHAALKAQLESAEQELKSEPKPAGGTGNVAADEVTWPEPPKNEPVPPELADPDPHVRQVAELLAQLDRSPRSGHENAHETPEEEAARSAFAELPHGVLDEHTDVAELLARLPGIPAGSGNRMSALKDLLDRHLDKLGDDARFVGLPAGVRRAMTDDAKTALAAGRIQESAEAVRRFQQAIADLGAIIRLRDYRAHVDGGYRSAARLGMSRVDWLKHAVTIEEAVSQGQQAKVREMLDAFETAVGDHVKQLLNEAKQGEVRDDDLAQRLADLTRSAAPEALDALVSPLLESVGNQARDAGMSRAAIELWNSRLRSATTLERHKELQEEYELEVAELRQSQVLSQLAALGVSAKELASWRRRLDSAVKDDVKFAVLTAAADRVTRLRERREDKQPSVADLEIRLRGLSQATGPAEASQTAGTALKPGAVEGSQAADMRRLVTRWEPEESAARERSAQALRGAEVLEEQLRAPDKIRPIGGRLEAQLSDIPNELIERNLSENGIRKPDPAGQ